MARGSSPPSPPAVPRAVIISTTPALPEALGDLEPAPSPPEASAPFEFPFFVDPVGYHSAVEVRIARGTWGKGPVAAWMRPRVPLVAGEVPSPLQRLLVAADSASGLAVVLDHTRYTFVNAHLTVTVTKSRPPLAVMSSAPTPRRAIVTARFTASMATSVSGRNWLSGLRHRARSRLPCPPSRNRASRRSTIAGLPNTALRSRPPSGPRKSRTTA